MKTIKEVASNSNIPVKLIRAVVRQLGGWKDAKESFSDIANHGIDGGFTGFINYSDTSKFFKRNRIEIAELVNTIASDLGENPIDMVAQFNCLGGREARECRAAKHGFAYPANTVRLESILNEYRPSVARCLYGGKNGLIVEPEDMNVMNALAWFAAEEVARAFTE